MQDSEAQRESHLAAVYERLDLRPRPGADITSPPRSCCLSSSGLTTLDDEEFMDGPEHDKAKQRQHRAQQRLGGLDSFAAAPMAKPGNGRGDDAGGAQRQTNPESHHGQGIHHRKPPDVFQPALRNAMHNGEHPATVTGASTMARDVMRAVISELPNVSHR
jgi:hypothetical protein